MSVVSLDEYRAELEEQAAAEPAPLELSLANARGLAIRYAGGPEIGEADREAGPCGHCELEAFVRWALGRFLLCRVCRQRCASSAEAAV